MRLLSWLPPPAATFIYTVFLRPKPLRLAAQWVVKRLIPPRLSIGDVELVLNRGDAIVSGALALGCYERFELDLFTSLLRPGMGVVDAGANIGLYAAVAARRVAPGGQVLAIEPHPENCEFIRRTRELNRLDNLAIVERAVAEVNGPGKLYLCATNPADHRLHDGSGARPAIDVKLVRLDDLAQALAMPRIDVLKMDVQGAEARAFAGMKRLAEKHTEMRILMELWPWGLAQAGDDPRRLLREIRDLGFRVYEIKGHARRITEVEDDEVLAARRRERQHVNLLLQRSPLAGAPASGER